MKQITRLVALAVAVLTLTPAFAAEPVFAPAMRIGLTPLDGMTPSQQFPGFQTPDGGIKVILGELPIDAFKTVNDAFKASKPSDAAQKIETLATQAGTGLMTMESGENVDGKVRLYSLIIDGGSFSGYAAVQVKEAAQATYTDDKVRGLLASAVLRKSVPVPEQLALLPFNVTELSGFKTVRTVMLGSAILLTDDAEDAVDGKAPYVLVSVVQAKPESPDTRDRFAQQAAAAIQGLNNGRITSSEPVRIDGAPGFETRIEATTIKDDRPIQLVQWLRFGGNATLRIIAASAKDEWASAFPRFRAVRDGVQAK